MRSMATRSAHTSVPAAISDSLKTPRASGFDLVILETAGIGQSSSEVVDLADISLYVMTPNMALQASSKKSICWTSLTSSQ